MAETPTQADWRCDKIRDHGHCNAFNSWDDESCGACGTDRPAAPSVGEPEPTICPRCRTSVDAAELTRFKGVCVACFMDAPPPPASEVDNLLQAFQQACELAVADPLYVREMESFAMQRMILRDDLRARLLSLSALRSSLEEARKDSEQVAALKKGVASLMASRKKWKLRSVALHARLKDATDSAKRAAEDAAQVCYSRARSLSEHHNHGEANEARKCAGAIRLACGVPAAMRRPDYPPSPPPKPPFTFGPPRAPSPRDEP